LWISNTPDREKTMQRRLVDLPICIAIGSAAHSCALQLLAAGADRSTFIEGEHDVSGWRLSSLAVCVPGEIDQHRNLIVNVLR
jgi:hypothetical protein